MGKEKKDSSMVSHKRIGIRFKVIVPVAIMNIIIGVVLTTFVLNALKTQCVYSGAEGTLSIASIASETINGNTLQKVLADGSTSSSYDITYNYMSVISESTDVVRIYTIGKGESDNYCYLVDIYSGVSI